MNKQNTIHFHLCGGAAINIGDTVISNLMELGKGFSKIEVSFLDTSTNNISKLKNYDDPDFHRVSNAGFTGGEIVGSGGDRTTHVEPIKMFVNEYLDTKKLTEPVSGIFHVVVSSLSGGSGSLLSPLLTKGLLERNIPVVVVAIGDSGNGLAAINSLKTLQTYNQIATKVTKKPLSIIYVNNTAFNNSNKEGAEKAANKVLFNTLATLSLFLSGENGELDTQDLVNFVNQSNYKTINIKPGLYGLLTFSGDAKVPDGAIPTVARSLTTEGVSPDIDLTLLHHKSGIVLEENAFNIYGEQFPLHLLTYANFMVNESKQLNKVVDDYNNIMSAIEIEDVAGIDESDESDDGLIF